MDRLIVKNFGPLKDIDIELNKINLFIGENGSGKSVLAKLITILSNVKLNTLKDDIAYEINFEKELKKYNIDFIKENTLISFFNNEKSYKILYKKDNLNISTDEYVGNIIGSEEENINQNVNSLNFAINLMGNVFNKLEKLSSKYIPSERNFVSIISKSLSSFLVADIPLPKFFLEFSSEFEKATNIIKKLEIFSLKYVNSEGLDRHKVYFDKENYLPLNESSSGIQAVIPLLITYKYFTQKYHTIVIEEPEQNLFPKAQKEVVDFLIENLQEKNRLFLMTHSPYILTALNNLILANDVKEAKGEEAIKGLVKVSQCIPFENINAYYIKDGKAVNIMDKENRLIGVNIIDEISDEVNETFDILLSKLD